MSTTSKLLFFNKEGYPYNFTLNNDIWGGKLFFDPNSTDIFKSESIYVLEQVDVINYDNTIDIINNEIYNDKGMTITPFADGETIVTNIIVVNESSKFYTKWIYGTKLNRNFPTSSIISFNNGSGDYSSDKYFTVLQTKKNAIMIATDTDNASYNFVYDETLKYTIVSNRVISFPDFGRNLQSKFSPDNDMKLSLVGTDYNDGVYEIESKRTTYSSIFDYELTDLLENDIFRIDLELLTERPLLYSGKFDISVNDSIISANFYDGVNSIVKVGSRFIVETVDGEHLYNANEYTIESFLTEYYYGDFNIELISFKETEDNSIIYTKNYMIYDKNEFQVEEDEEIILRITGNSNGNTDIKRRIMHIEAHPEYVNSNGDSLYVAQLNKLVYDNNDTYSIYKVLKDFEQNTAIVTSSIDYTDGSYDSVICMLTTNIIQYTQEVTSNGIEDSIDSFITKYNDGFNDNGVDIYRQDTKLILDGMYSGQNAYFSSKMYINDETELISDNTYSDINGKTSIYNFIVKEGDLVYESFNMGDELAVPFYADIILNIYDDAQDYGFNISINNVDFYIEFNDDAGSTTNTDTTITSFIEKWNDIFNKNGFNISSNIIDGVSHFYIEGQEPNIEVYDFSVKVNKNSSYETTTTTNVCSMVTSNYLYSSTSNFISSEFTTGMIISMHGSNYSMNNGEYNIIGLFNDKLELSYQGAMQTDKNVMININTREFLRRPRESNTEDIKYNFRWSNDIIDDIFLYDFSGENLETPWGDNPKLKYTGVKPLTLNGDNVYLNKEPNKKIEYVKFPQKQQTVFDELSYTLEKFDDDNATILPKPITLFLGYNSSDEGVQSRELIMERIDNVSYSGFADGIDLYFDMIGNSLFVKSTENIDLLSMGFKVDRTIQMKFDDNKSYTQKLFENWQDYVITDVTKTKITLDSTLTEMSTLGEEFTFSIEQLPETIGQFVIYGETEAEDERLEANMKMIGVSLMEEDEFIFKSSDVNEMGIDYRLLNRKRKEMMNVYPEIYNYIGSYKAILNAINFFGYTDLMLIEYYKNIDEDSTLYGKLKRVVIPDVLDRDVEGYSYSEDLSKRIGYRKTNLMNLTYRITDDEGNNVNLYSLDEVQYKLVGLKKWLRKWVIPVNSNIRDITGLSENVGTIWRKFEPLNITSQKTIESTTAINFNYISTRNFNDNWLVSIRFYSVDNTIPESFDLKVVTYTKNSDNKLVPQQQYDIFKTDMLPFNFSLNWVDKSYDKFFSIETQYYNERGMGIKVDKMYRVEDGITYIYDEFKNYTLINNNFKYKYPINMQDNTNVYIVDSDSSIYVIEK